MRISKNSQILDCQQFTPQELFTSLQGMSHDISLKSNSNISIDLRKKTDILHNFQSVLKDNETRRTLTQKKPKKLHGLKKIIQEQKIKSIIRNFIIKLRRNNVNGTPVQYEPFQQQEKHWLEQEGFNIPQVLDNALALVSVFQIFFLTIIYTLSMVFSIVLDSPLVTYFQTFSILFYLLEIFIHLTAVTSYQGRKLSTLKQISLNYLQRKFSVDMISITILMVDVLSQFQYIIYLRLFILFKIGNSLEKIQKLENYFIDNFYKEQYWGLIKVFMLNFSFAHCLAILLIAMAELNPQKNWISSRGWTHQPWNQIYAWAYYWGTTIMLTVGFGDISASNYQQAICLTLIETVSCITLAYNINCVGNLISNIRSQDIQKNRNYKVFKKLSQKNDIPDQISWRINNYIQQSTNIKKKFNFQQQNQFISKLPQGLKADFLKQSNKKIFQKLIFFKNLTEKTLLNFAQKIQMRICHPQEIIQRKDQDLSVLILKEGHIGFHCKKSVDYNDIIIDQIKIKQKQNPLLLSLQFISKSKASYQMKSMEYSILYCLSYPLTISILQNGQLDYEHYCQLRDKSRHIVDEYEVFVCEICKQHHTKFTCPKLHYIPFQQHVIMRHLHKEKKSKTSRVSYIRKKQIYATLRMSKIQNNQTYGKKDKDERSVSIRCPTFVQNIQKDVISENTLQSKQLDCNSQATVMFRKNVATIIMQEVTKAIGVQHPQQIWIIECDSLHNFKFYFTQNNAAHLGAVDMSSCLFLIIIKQDINDVIIQDIINSFRY